MKNLLDYNVFKDNNQEILIERDLLIRNDERNNNNYNKNYFKISIPQEFLELYTKLNEIKNAKVKEEILEKLKLIKKDFEGNSFKELQQILDKYKLTKLPHDGNFNSSDLKSDFRNFGSKLERSHIEKVYESNEFNKYLREERDEINPSKSMKKTKKAINSNLPNSESNLKITLNKNNSNSSREIFIIDCFKDASPIRSINNRIGDYNDYESKDDVEEIKKKKFKNKNRKKENNYQGESNIEEESHAEEVSIINEREKHDI